MSEIPMDTTSRPGLDLRDIPAVIVNLPGQTLRRQSMEALFTRLGIAHRFVDGVTQFRKKRNIAKAMTRAHGCFAAAPYLVCEDDLQLLAPDVVLPPPPADADIIYLAVNDSGCLPSRPDYSARYQHRAYRGLALAEDHDEHYLRVTSMISAIAVLVLSERGRERFVRELRIAFNRDTAVDVRFAYAMADLRVYTPRLPVFAEDMDLQSETARSEDRRLLTHAPLTIAREGDLRVGQGSLFRLEVCARRNPLTGALDWEVQQDWPTRRARRFGLA